MAEARTWIRVWDRFVRVFHWALLVAFVVAFASHEDGYGALHLVSGYAVTALVGARLIWGFAGSRYARFTEFVRGPNVVLAYLVALVRGQVRRYLGHNPAGGSMIVVMLALLAVVSVIGILLTTTRFYGDELMFDLHEAAVDLMLVCVLLHVAGVLWSSRVHRENLIKAMWTGRKRPLDEPADGP
jgi:cytochrome b